MKEFKMIYLYSKLNSPLFISSSEGNHTTGLKSDVPSSPRVFLHMMSPLVRPWSSPAFTSRGNKNSANSPISRRVSVSLWEELRDDCSCEESLLVCCRSQSSETRFRRLKACIIKTTLFILTELYITKLCIKLPLCGPECSATLHLVLLPLRKQLHMTTSCPNQHHKEGVYHKQLHRNHNEAYKINKCTLLRSC